MERPSTYNDVDVLMHRVDRVVIHRELSECPAQAEQRGPLENEQEKETWGGSDQVVLHGVAGGSYSRGDPDLAKNLGQVGIDSAGTDDELLGYLLICQSLGHQAQHLHLPGSQFIGIAG